MFEETKFNILFKPWVSKIEYVKGGPRDLGAVFKVIKISLINLEL